MNKKIKYLAILVILTVITISTFAGIGDTLTPTQFKNIDVNNHNFNPKIQPNEIKKNYFFATVTIESFEKTETDYETIFKNIIAVFKMDKYADCRRDKKTQEECKAEMKTNLIDDIIKRIDGEKQMLEREQAKIEYANELTENSIIITTEDIKNASEENINQT